MMKYSMFKDIFTFNYHHRLVVSYSKSSSDGALASNIIGSIFVFVVLFNSVPLAYLITFVVINICIYIVRKITAIKLLKLDTKVYDLKYLKMNFFLVLLTAISYPSVILIATLYGVDEAKLLLLYMGVTAVVAGSIGTQGIIFTAFVLYSSFSLIPLVVISIFYGSETLYMFSFIIFVYFPIHIVSGYRYFISLRDSISLKDTFQTIYDKSSDGIVIIQNSRFKDCNESILKMFDYENKSIFLNTKLTQLSPKLQPDGISSTRKLLIMLNKAYRDGSNSFEWIHKTTADKEFWVEIVLTRINLDGEELIHGVWRDISDRKNLEIKQVRAQEEIEALNHSLADRVEEEVGKNRKKDQQLLEQSRLAQMGEMLSMIAHQWRQPLAAISSSSSALELKANLGKIDKETVLRNSQNISKYTQHLSTTIDDFRDFFKPNKELSSVTYYELIDSALSILEISLKTKNISLIRNCDCGERFNTYANEMKQVILNLIKNAEDILVEKGTQNPYVKLATYTLDDKYILEVSDNGGGIPEEIIDKIFDPYFSTKLDKNGTGLGLYMSKIIVEDHCYGKLNVTNNEDGALFQVVISAS
ncbi:MAG: PAS domain-containing protein [Sulfurimonas sp.]|nr:PAS domain-containing protein [Sulfurimonas sp.]